MTSPIIASTIVLGVAGLSASLAHRASASLRHAIWLVGLVTALAVGILAAAGPLLVVQSSLVPAAPSATILPDAAVVDVHAAVPVTPAVPTTATAPADIAASPLGTSTVIRFSLVALWVLGAAILALRVVAARYAASRLIERSRHLDVELRMDVDASIDVRLSPDVDAPVTMGAWRPVILLPMDAQYWASERLRIVLVHEAAHIARRDYVAQVIATLVCAVYWFNPIVWLAAARLRAEAEHAADDHVLAAGIDGVVYASHLLELARPEAAQLSTAMAVGMARGNRLERRFTAMLDSSRSRRTVPLRLQAAAGSAALLVAIPFTSVKLVPMTPEITPVTASSGMPAVIVAPAPAQSVRPVATILSAADTVIDRTIAAASGEQLSIQLRSTGGAIVIHGWNQQQVRLHAVLSGTQARETEVTFARAGRGVELRAEVPRTSGNTSNSNSFELWVPRKFDVQVSSAGGEISVTGVEGRITGNTGGGEIALDDVKGYAELSTGGGEVNITASDLEGHVTTGGGEARVTRTTGSVRVSSGGGGVIRTDNSGTRVYGVGGLSPTTTITGQSSSAVAGATTVSSGSMSYTSAGGDIRMADAPYGGSFTTGGGDIVIGSIGGRASFTTGGGDITLSRVQDDVSATTGAGDVQITVVDGSGNARNITVASGLGQVIIELPASLDARFDLESAYTEGHNRSDIKSDFPVNVTETSDWDTRNGTPRRYVRATGTAGSGRGLIKVRTVNGDVVIKRR